jgi:hypothetical protein
MVVSWSGQAGTLGLVGKQEREKAFRTLFAPGGKGGLLELKNGHVVNPG